MRAWLAREGIPRASAPGPAAARSRSEEHTGDAGASGGPPAVTVMAAPRASVGWWPLFFLCTDRAEDSSREEMGAHHDSREVGMATPHGCRFPTSNPPLVISPKPLSQFAH